MAAIGVCACAWGAEWRVSGHDSRPAAGRAGAQDRTGRRRANRDGVCRVRRRWL